MKPHASLLMFAGALALAACNTTETSSETSPEPAASQASIEPYKSEPVFKGEYISIADVSERPRPVFQTAPVFPHLSDLKITEGKALIHFIISKEGLVQQAQCSNATNKAFAQSAISALARSRWEPAKLDGAPVNCLVMQRITFHL